MDSVQQRRLNQILSHISQSELNPRDFIKSHKTSSNGLETKSRYDKTGMFPSKLDTTKEPIDSDLSKARTQAKFNPSVLNAYITGSEFLEQTKKVFELIKKQPVDKILPRHEDMKLERAELLALRHSQLEHIISLGILSTKTLKREFMTFQSMMNAIGWVAPDLGVKLLLQFAFFGGAILNLGTEQQFNEWSPKIDTGEVQGLFAITEISHGSNVRGIGLEAKFDRSTGEFVLKTPNLESTKWWIGNSSHATHGIIFANCIDGDGTNHGVHAFVVGLRPNPRSATYPHVYIGDVGPKAGNPGLDNGWIQFDSYRIPRTALLARYGYVDESGKYSSPIPNPNKRFGRILGELTMGRTAIVTASAEFLAFGVLVATRYAVKRKQFGLPGKPEVPLLYYKTQRRKLMPYLAGAYALKLTSRYMLDRYTKRTAQESEQLHLLSTGLKALSTWICADGLKVFREACGGHGYLAYALFGQAKNDQDVMQTFEGDNVLLLQASAKELLTQYRRQYGGIFSGPLNFISQELSLLAAKANPFSDWSMSEGHLLDPNAQLDAFNYRAARMLHTSALRLRSALKREKTPLDAWNSCQTHLVDMAAAHADRFIVERFILAVEACPDPACRTIMKDLCDTYVLWRMQANLSWWQSHYYFGRRGASLITKTLEKLNDALADQAIPLTDAFEIDDFFLSSPLARERGKVYESLKAHADYFSLF